MDSFRPSKSNIALAAVLSILVWLLLSDYAGKSNADGYENINPDSGIYRVKRLSEKASLSLPQSQEQKLMKLNGLLGKRFREIRYISDKNQLDYLDPATQRYITTAGLILENDQNPTANITELKGYLSSLKSFRDRYSSRAKGPYWLMLQQTIDTTERLIVQ